MYINNTYRTIQKHINNIEKSTQVEKWALIEPVKTAYIIKKQLQKMSTEDIREMDGRKLSRLTRTYLLCVYKRPLDAYISNYKGYNTTPTHKKQYAYIPYKTAIFTNFLIENMEDGMKFLDIGTGIGDKPLIANLLFPKSQCDGIEYDFYPVGIGEKFINGCLGTYGDGIKLMCKDAFKFKKYHQYDFIYTYSPISDTDMLRKMYVHVAKQLKPGTKWLEVYTNLTLRESLLKAGIKIKQISDYVIEIV